MLFLLLVAIAGFAAQLVDGSLGMGYGVLSMSLLMAFGVAPAVASASVHIAKIGTGLASGISHWRFGNVDGKVMVLLAVPGAIGAYAGAMVLSSLSLSAARPWVSVVLLILGGVILLRFLHGRRTRSNGTQPIESKEAPEPPKRPRWMLVPLGLVGGFVDASGGGGWGPVTTSTLMASGRLPARITIGTVNAAELAVAIAASVGFLQALGAAGVRWDVAVAMLAGGVVAAPIAAWLVRHIQERTLGVAVGVLIVLLSADSIMSLLRLPDAVLITGRVGALAVTGLVLVVMVVRGRRAGRETVGDGPAGREPEGARGLGSEPAAD
ncbi:MAG: sulfite exporter TauE/SafE family protein [Chloroflexota bacterium]|nr:sulfite exporter TauE/SafE family protein [Chloroflexota bacterium]